MKHAGKAQKAALKIILVTLAPALVLLVVSCFSKGLVLTGLASTLMILWVLFTVFTLNFFRDPEARPPEGKGLVLSPAHGTVDVVDDTSEDQFMGGPCKRISIFLNVFDVHVQKAPVTGKVVFQKHTDGQYLSATKSDCGSFNENVLIGIVPEDSPRKKIAIRLIAGLIARRIIVWATEGETITRGERISLVQFGSRGDVYLPRDAKIQCKLGDKVIGGETILAVLE